MLNLKLVISFLAVLLFTNTSIAATLSVDDFFPPAQAGPPQQAQDLLKVANPEAVKNETSAVTGTPAISAASAQDAINTFIQQRSAGFSALEFPSGMGFAATGVATYEKHKSVVAARIDQRNAFVKAYTHAKKNLAEGFYGISNEGKTKLNEYMANIDTANEQTLTNYSENLSEQIAQRVEGMVRGYVVYDVHDDFDNSTVYVTIVTTPKTQGHYARPSADSIVASSIREGLSQVLSEIQKGLTPPVGGKTIMVPQTGELAFVGFGSAVVRQDTDKAMQTKHNLNAQKIAKMRSVDSLCGIILGDDIASTSELDSQTKSMIKDYEEVAKDDPLAKKQEGEATYKALENRKKEFLSTEISSTTISSMRKGVLPAGVKTQGWMDDEKAFAFGVAIYMPSVTKQADDARKTMQQGTIVQPTTEGETPRSKELPKGELKQGPSGQVQSNDAL